MTKQLFTTLFNALNAYCQQNKMIIKPDLQGNTIILYANEPDHEKLTLLNDGKIEMQHETLSEPVIYNDLSDYVNDYNENYLTDMLFDIDDDAFTSNDNEFDNYAKQIISGN